MKWTYSIRGKASAILLLSLVLGITILTNLLERNRFKELERSFTSMYEDRLMAENYLFHLYENLKKKEDLLQLLEEDGMSESMLNQLRKFKEDRSQILEKYTVTYLTEEEKKEFDNFKKILARMDGLEERIRNSEPESATAMELIESHEDVSGQAFSSLSALSDVQTSEGEALRDKSKRIVMRSVSMSHFEMTILIIVGLIIQGLILSSKTLMIREQQKPSLN